MKRSLTLVKHPCNTTNRLKGFVCLIAAILMNVNTSFSQNWLEPVNISNNSEFTQCPSICIDNENNIYVVWTYVYDINFSRVFLSKSLDNGFTWSTPEAITNNEDKRIYWPNLICDSLNNLHLTYDFNVGNVYESNIYYQFFDGNGWGDPFLISENMGGADENKLVMNKTGRLFCFWRYSANNANLFYRTMENGIWSEITYAYPGGFSLVLEEIMCDENNNLHGVAWYNNTQQPYYHSQTAYIKYDDLNSSWIDPTAISPITYGDNIFGIDVDEFGNPHVAYRQKTPLTGPDNDSTMYTFYNGTEWEIPELIVEDPLEQSIIMDHNNKANIFNTEKIESGKRLVTYYKTGNEWMGYIIDEAKYNISQVKTIATNSSIYVVYVHSVTGGTGEIYFSQSDMISSSKNTFTSNATLQVSPNPFNKECRIICSTDKKDYTSVKIYSFSGLLINTLLEGYYTAGSFELLWNGKDQNGKEVKSGTYLVRLQSGRNVQTKSVMYVK